MKSHFTVILFILAAGTFASIPDTLQVTTHKRVLVVTNPSTGEKSFVRWGSFPGKETNVRSIRMTVTLGCPDSIPCAHWDYLDHIYVRRQGGVHSKSMDYEIGRMLTPYGSIFDRGWEWNWSADITDFANVLRDSVEIEYVHSGYEPSTVGWALTIRFDIITGKPAAKAISITRMWEGSFKYGDPAVKIEDQLAPIKFRTDKSASFARFRIQQTGHGMDEPKGCSEFCSKYREIKLDDKLIDKRNLWKECGDNPLYPQGGTWIYARGNWCPGDLQEAETFDVHLDKGEHTLGIYMQPYLATGNIQAHESIASYLIQYKSPESANDVAIAEVLSPNSTENLNRKNPVCAEPHIVIRNLGKEILHSTVIWYGTQGYPMRKHTWHGSLRFNEICDIWLEGPINFKPGKNMFIVNATMPNGKKDGWEADNEMKVNFDSPIVLPNQIIVQFRSNEHPTDNKLSLIDAFGGIIYIREPSSFKPHTMYFDTLKLDAGCYELNLSDTAGNGLEFWDEPEQGYGFLRLLDQKGRLLYNFESDCGSGQHLAFSASVNAQYDTTKNRLAFSVFPLRVKDKLVFDCVASWPTDITVLIKGSENEILEKHEFLGLKNRLTNIDISHLPVGRYFFEVQVDGIRQFKKRFNKE